jgi:hypothetical protein
MKKAHLSGMFLLLCLAAPLAATWLALQGHRIEVRREVRARLLAGMDDSELTLLRFHRDDAQRELQWKEDGEFRYRGAMYDVARTIHSADSVHYLVFRDDAESHIERTLDTLVAHALGMDGKDSDQLDRLGDYLRSLFFRQPEVIVAPADLPFRDRPASASLPMTRSGSPPEGPPPRLA